MGVWRTSTRAWFDPYQRSPEIHPQDGHRLRATAKMQYSPSLERTDPQGEIKFPTFKMDPQELHASPVMSEVSEIKKTYALNRVCFVEGNRMKRILALFGSREADFDGMRKLSDDLSKDPSLSFRLSRNGRFCIDFENGVLTRLEHQPFILTEDEDFCRHDSGMLRRFAELHERMHQNSVFVALMRFKAFVIGEISPPVKQRRNLDYSSPKTVTTVFHVRTCSTRETLGEPALEGVHSDGVDHTMTTFLGGRNLAPGSGISQIHKPEQKNGLPWNGIDTRLVTGEYQHRAFLDTLLIVDHEFKHSVSPVFIADDAVSAERDMLIFFSRKPAMAGHPSFPYDALTPNRQMPLRVDLENASPSQA